MLIFFIIFLVVGIVAFGFSIYLIYDNDIDNVPSEVWRICASIILIIIGTLGICVIPIIPTEKDVLSGKAVYQEILYINNSDTIKTYKIVWKNDRN